MIVQHESYFMYTVLIIVVLRMFFLETVWEENQAGPLFLQSLLGLGWIGFVGKWANLDC